MEIAFVNFYVIALRKVIFEKYQALFCYFSIISITFAR